MGRPRTNLKTQSRHSTKQEIFEREMSEKAIEAPSDELEKPPIWLRDTVAKNEWKRLMNNFKIIGIINNLDLNNLGLYCNAYSNYRQTVKEMKGKKLVVDDDINPLIKTQLKYSDEIRRYGALLGLTIDSRLKLGQLKVNKQKDAIADEFGDI